jgi:hypothetical protein
MAMLAPWLVSAVSLSASAVHRARQHDPRAAALEACPRRVHPTGGKRLAVDAAHRRAGARLIDGEPRLVHERVHVADVHRRRIDVLDRVAALLVVHVDEARHEDLAAALVAAIEDEADVVEEAVGAGAHHGIGARAVAEVRRAPADDRRVERMAGEEAAAPGRAAVHRLIHAEPCVALVLGRGCGGGAFLVRERRGIRKVNGAVIVRAGEQVAGVARGDRERWFVLTLQERIAADERRAAHHVDVGARHERTLTRNM